MLARFLKKIPSITSNGRGIANTNIFRNKTVPELSTSNLYKVNKFERKLLVWSGKFKTVEEIPAYVSPEIVEKARTHFRIRFANWTMVIVLLMSGVAAYLGKKAHKSGHSLETRNLEAHREYQEHVKNEK